MEQQVQQNSILNIDNYILINKLNKNNIISENNYATVKINHSSNKRHRRGKAEITDRTYQCPDCLKSYFSAPALSNHRKNKHGYVPKKKNQEDISSSDIKSTKSFDFNSFFNESYRRPKLSESNGKIQDQNEINAHLVEEYFIEIYKQCKNTLFKKDEILEDVPFFEVITKNWENPIYEIVPSSETYPLIDKKKDITIDRALFIYLKCSSKLINKYYFWFLLKLVIIIRQSINISKNQKNNNSNNDSENPEPNSNSKKQYTEENNCYEFPKLLNVFYTKFFEPNTFFGLNQDESFKVIQHLCDWLYNNQLTYIKTSL